LRKSNFVFKGSGIVNLPLNPTKAPEKLPLSTKTLSLGLAQSLTQIPKRSKFKRFKPKRSKFKRFKPKRSKFKRFKPKGSALIKYKILLKQRVPRRRPFRRTFYPFFSKYSSKKTHLLKPSYLPSRVKNLGCALITELSFMHLTKLYNKHLVYLLLLRPITSSSAYLHPLLNFYLTSRYVNGLTVLNQGTGIKFSGAAQVNPLKPLCNRFKFAAFSNLGESCTIFNKRFRLPSLGRVQEPSALKEAKV
jgi:hypothetical protein